MGPESGLCEQGPIVIYREVDRSAKWPADRQADIVAKELTELRFVRPGFVKELGQ